MQYYEGSGSKGQECFVLSVPGSSAKNLATIGPVAFEMYEIAIV